MSHNTFDHLFRVTTWGDSHGPAIGCVVDGCPPWLPLSERDIQPWLDRRRPGQSRFTTQRREPDKVRILSDVSEGRATGAPIVLQIANTDQRSTDHGHGVDRYRRNHADLTYDLKYGIRDYQGCGRSSARETASRVTTIAITRCVLGSTIRGALVQVSSRPIDRTRWNWSKGERNSFYSPDSEAAEQWAEDLIIVHRSGSSVNAVIEIVADGLPAGLSAPIYGKRDADIAGALMSINAVKGVEIGYGFATASMRGEDNADEMSTMDSQVHFHSNHSDRILGGISTGQPIIDRFAVKPINSIIQPGRSIDREGNPIEVSTHSRRDPCVDIRAVPVGETVVAYVLTDHLLRHRIQVPQLQDQAQVRHA